MTALEVIQIRKSFGAHEVLRGIDFSLEEGKMLSIIGSSGSGKTTLLRCLNFLETPDGGQILVDGKSVFDSREKARVSDEEIRLKRLSFGLVFQSFNLFPQYTVLGNLTLAPMLRLKEQIKKGEISKSEKKEESDRIESEARDILARVGLAEKIDYYPCQLSGGQQQRVAIARALVLKPKILCFDEPTSALDPELTGEVLKVIRALRDEGRTMIVVTHEMEFARQVSDEIIFMANGVIEESGTPEKIFDSPESPLLQNFLAGIRK